MELSGDMPITLVIKAPNQRMADQTVDCMLGWTIKKLKQHLETVYPTKPKHNEQRLIYSGRLLQDHLTLKEILRQYDSRLSNRHTVHLVCSSDSNSSSTTSLSSKAVSGNSHEVTAPSPFTENSSSGGSGSESLNIDRSEGLRHRGHSHIPEPASGQVPPTSPPATYQAGVPGDVASYSPEQYAWMIQQQQMYSQYMMQYMLYYQNMYSTGLPLNYQMPPSSLAQQVAGDSLPQQQQPPHHQEAAPANNNGVQGAARPNVLMNAQGGMEEEEDEDGAPRDWLHHVYFFMRFLTFLSILYFYSNLTRFLVVFAGSFAVYFLQKFRKYMQRAQQQQSQNQQAEQQQPPPPDQGEQHPPQPDQGEQHPPQPDQGEQHPPQPDQGEQQQHVQDEQQEKHLQADVRNEETQEDVPTQPPHSDTGSGQQPAPDDDGSRITRIVIFICHTIQTFFTSLLPTPPELLEPN